MSSPNPDGLPPPLVFALKIILTDVLCEALFLGVQWVVTIIGVYILWNRSPQLSRGHIILLGAIILLFCMSVVSLATTIWDYMATYEELGTTGFDATRITNDATIIAIVVQRLTYFISDCIVVWRAWVLWPRKLWVKCLLIICLLGTITATFVQGGMAYFRQVRHPGEPEQDQATRTLMFTLPLLFTNLVSTILIGVKLWQYRHLVMRSLNESRSRVQRIMIIVVESSVLYCIVWILASLSTTGVFHPIAAAAVLGSLPYVTCIYPILIVILVALEKDECSTTFGTIDFATVTANPNTYAETQASDSDVQTSRAEKILGATNISNSVSFLGKKETLVPSEGSV